MSRKGIKYPCQRCGYERAARDDPCPTCDGQPQHDVVGRGFLFGPPQYKCPECGWEPTHVRPSPRRSERFCGQCSSEMLLWQNRSPLSQCQECERIIEYPNEYCEECWEEWHESCRNIAVWSPPREERRRRRNQLPTTSSRRSRSSWDRSQRDSWGGSSGGSWEDQEWNAWGGAWHGEAAAETVSQSAQWQAMPPPTSLDSGAPSKRARSQSDRPRFWQPKASGPSSSSGSQSAEAAPPPAAPEAVPEAVPEAAPAADPEPPESSGGQQAEAADAAMADSGGNQSVEAAEATVWKFAPLPRGTFMCNSLRVDWAAPQP